MSIELFRSINLKTNKVEPLRGPKQRSLFQTSRAYTAPEVLKNIHHEFPYRVKIPMMPDPTNSGKQVVDRSRKDEARQFCLDSFGEDAFTSDEHKMYMFTKNARWTMALFWVYFRTPEDLTLYQLRWR